MSIADPSQHRLSFENMLELARAGRPPARARRSDAGGGGNALDYLQTKLRVARPLIDEQMLTDGKTIPVHRLDQLIDAGQEGQTSLRQAPERWAPMVPRKSSRRRRGQVERSGNHEGGAGGPSGSRSQAGMSRSAWSRRQTSTWSSRST